MYFNVFLYTIISYFHYPATDLESNASGDSEQQRCKAGEECGQLLMLGDAVLVCRRRHASMNSV